MKKTVHTLLSLCFIVLMLSFSTGSFANDNKAVAHLQKALSKLSQMQATFYQRVIGSELSIIDEGAGKFYLSRPGKFRWDYFADDGKTLVDQIVSDGVDIYFYNTDLETVTVRSLQQAVLQVPSLVLVSDSVDIKKIFQVTELPENLGLNWFLLKPVSADASYDELRLGFSNGKLIAFSIVDGLGRTTQLQFDAIKNGTAIASSVFKFAIPEGADVSRGQ